MCMVTSGTSICHARSTTSDARVGNISDTRVCLYVFVYVYVIRTFLSVDIYMI